VLFRSHGREPASLVKMAMGAAGVALSYLLLAAVASAGHSVQGDRPLELAALVADFVART